MTSVLLRTDGKGKTNDPGLQLRPFWDQYVLIYQVLNEISRLGRCLLFSYLVGFATGNKCRYKQPKVQ
jgi:hypothetical protein